ncbi:hypothetical protein D3C85_1075270 [compost metagenome]
MTKIHDLILTAQHALQLRRVTVFFAVSEAHSIGNTVPNTGYFNFLLSVKEEKDSP